MPVAKMFGMDEVNKVLSLFVLDFVFRLRQPVYGSAEQADAAT